MYNKLFTKILDSSIWLAPDPHRLVWITLIAAMDEEGNAMFASAGNLAARARVTREQAEAAVVAFEAPDPDSGDPDNEGRRIERFPGGWHVLNAAKYRALVTKAIIQEQTRARVAKFRAKAAGVALGDAPVTHEQRNGNAPVTPSVSIAVAEATSEAIPGGAPPDPPAPAALSGKPARKRAGKPAAPTGDVWAAYSQAYKERYQVEPVRNAKVNGQLAQLVSRLGAEEAPGVARSYLDNRNGLYVASKHCVDLLLRDAEKLRTEWATGNVTHQRDARESDRLASVGGMVERVSAALAAKGIE